MVVNVKVLIHFDADTLQFIQVRGQTVLWRGLPDELNRQKDKASHAVQDIRLPQPDNPETLLIKG